MTSHNCDICGSDAGQSIVIAKQYVGDNDVPAVCTHCGFVYVRERRSPKAIAAAWDDMWGETYTSDWPGVKARLYYVAEYFEHTQGWKGKTVLDVGAGQGFFCKQVESRGGEPWGLDPSPANAELAKKALIPWTLGTIEDHRFVFNAGHFDVVTILWTLENCGDPVGMLQQARRLLKPDGWIVVATGSRILVPFRKPLSTYFSKNPADTHASRFSQRSLANILNKTGFSCRMNNDYEQNDVLIMLAQPSEAYCTGLTDPWKDVEDFFERWHEQFP